MELLKTKQIDEVTALKLENLQLKLEVTFNQKKFLETKTDELLGQFGILPQNITKIDFEKGIITYKEPETVNKEIVK